MGDSDPLHLRFGAFELNEKDARLSQNGQPLAIAPKVFAVLCALARQPGQLVTKNELLDTVWGHQHVSESVLKTIISELRAALSDDAKQPRYIETASRRGYRFIAAATALRALGSPAASAATAVNAASAPTRLEAPLMIGRQAALARLNAAWATAQAGRRQIVWVAGEAGIGKTTLIDNFVAGLGPVTVGHGQCVEQFGAGGAVLAGAGGAGGAVPQRPKAGHVAARRRAHMVAAIALVEQRGGTRSPAPRIGCGRSGAHAARVGRTNRSLHTGSPTLAGDRGLTLERSGERALDQSHRTPPGSRALHVAGELSPGRSDRSGSSAEIAAQ